MNLYVSGIGLWATQYASIGALSRDEADPAVERPPCSLAPSRLMRGTSLLTRMLVESASQAAEDAGVDLGNAATVFGSAFGETQIAIDQLEMMRTGDGIVSPARFKNSVHNTGAGVFSIATKNRRFNTALAGGWETTASVLLEAAGLLGQDYEHVVVAVADEPIPESMDKSFVFHGAGVGFVLSRTHKSAKHGVLQNLRITDASGPETDFVRDELARNPIAPAIGLALRLYRKQRGPATLTLRGDVHWQADIAPDTP